MDFRFNPAALAAANVHLWRGEKHVLRGVSFALRAGEALHVWGPNGAGKTTLLRVVCGLSQPEEGAQILWNGLPAHAPESSFLASLAYLAHDTALKGDLTALENLRFGIGLKRAITDREIKDLIEELDVGQAADLPCRVLSAGQRRRVALARVLLSNAPLWVLDEPFTNLDAAGCERATEAIQDHLNRGGLALIAAHQALQFRHGHVTRLGLD